VPGVEYAEGQAFFDLAKGEDREYDFVQLVWRVGGVSMVVDAAESDDKGWFGVKM